MKRCMPGTFPPFFYLSVVASAVALAACGGSSGNESVTSAPVVESARPAVDGGSVSESGKKNKVPICHKGKDKSVPQSAVDGHLRHGDTEGPCCPCFLATDIRTAAEDCPAANLIAPCNTSDPASLFLVCVAQADEPVFVIGIYESRTDTGSCKETKTDGTVMTQTGLSAAEHQACVDAMVSSGDYCS